MVALNKRRFAVTAGFTTLGLAAVLTLSGAYEAVVLMVSPASAPTRVTDAVYEPDDVTSSWYKENFSFIGAHEAQQIERGGGSSLGDPSALARTAFGLPASGALRCFQRR
jgi:hypothetical protein